MFTDEIKNRALTLWLEGIKLNAIPPFLLKEYNVKVSTPSIYNWKRDGNWGEIKDSVDAKAIQKIQENSIEQISDATTRQLKYLQKLTDKSGAFLNLGNDLPTDFGDARTAVNALDVGIKGEREVEAGLISQAFVVAVISVLTEEIDDENLLRRLAIRLKNVVAETSNI